MKFIELLKKYTDEEVIAELKKYYEDIDDESYKSALTELRRLTPSKEQQVIKINVEFVKNKNYKEPWLLCDRIGSDDETNEEIKWELEFDKWENWLAKEIIEDNFTKLDEITVLAGIVYEMTFFGFSQKTIQCRANDLNERIKYAYEHPENFIELTPELLDQWEKEIKLKKAK